MKSSNTISGNTSKAMLLVFLCWLVYSTSYLGKVNYSANITQIIDFYGVTKTQAGTAPTFFFFAYGIGQVFNGLFCKKYNVKWVIFASLITSATINLAVAVSTNFAVIKWLWLVNGFVLSILWPTLIRLISEVLPADQTGVSSLIMGTTVASGTLVIYGLSSIYALFHKFKFSFYTAGFAVIFVAFVWLFLYNKAVNLSKIEKDAKEAQVKKENDISLQNRQKKSDKRLIYAAISVLCFCAIGVNLTKDGLTTWVPSILKEEFSMNDSLSILLTLFLPVVAAFSNSLALKMHKKIPDYVNHCTVIFALIAVFIGVIVGSITLKLALGMLVGLIIVSFLASSLNNLITCVFPLFMRGKVNSGLLAGILNGFCYIGSTISAYGLGAVADKFGWTAVFMVFWGFCLMTFIVWGGYTVFKFAVTKTGYTVFKFAVTKTETEDI